MVLISDLMDKQGYEAALRMLVARDLDIFVVHLLSPEELQPELKGDLKLIDCEDADQREISISSSLLKRYHQTLNAFVEAAKSFCRKHRIRLRFAAAGRSMGTWSFQAELCLLTTHVEIYLYPQLY